MLYLEDYLEMIEYLPMEMRERLTEMRERDLQVQNELDSLDERVTMFFKKCDQPNVKTDWKDEQFGKIKKDYYKTLENADEKVQLANHVYDLVDRHLRKLDQELSKFKMELEADNAGITEVLEKRSLEMDKPVSVTHRAEKRRLPTTSLPSQTEKRLTTEKVLSTLANEIARDSIGNVVRKTQSASSSPNISMFNSVPSSSATLTYKLGHVGAGSNAAIAQAASQAIAATQQVMQCQGRRTPSMKMSYNVMTKGGNTELPKEFMKQEYNYSSQPSTPTVASSTEIGFRSQRQKKQTSKAAALQAQAQQQHQQQQQAQQQKQQAMSALSQQITAVDNSVSNDSSNELQIVNENGEPVNWQDDPNEPRYCLCNQVSYGDMVGCDNDDCPIEWFHYGCVGLNSAPKGKWYCPQCTAAMKRRGRR